jgi:muramidase (phage lysozyme)
MNEVLSNPNVLAFLQVIRTGEGTLGDKGYRTLYGGNTFESFEDHPRQLIKAGKWTSTAAGAYQFLSRTWDALVKQYGFKDFSPETQDLAVIALIKGRKALDDVLNGDISQAIKKCNKEWASLPGSPYGQPTMTLEKALRVYKEAGGRFRQSDEVPPQIEGTTMPLPFVAAVLPSLVAAVPDLIRIFGNSPRAEMNAKAAEIVVNAAKVATNSVNEQDLVEKLDSRDPLVVEQVRDAVRQVWFEISADTGGIQAAREVNAKSEGFWKQPAFWITCLLLPLVYGVVAAVMGFVGPGQFSVEIQIMVVSSIVSGLLAAISGFWLGTSWSSSRKTELAGK